jgi:hypothetical protein
MREECLVLRNSGLGFCLGVHQLCFVLYYPWVRENVGQPGSNCMHVKRPLSCTAGCWMFQSFVLLTESQVSAARYNLLHLYGEVKHSPHRPEATDDPYFACIGLRRAM